MVINIAGIVQITTPNTGDPSQTIVVIVDHPARWQCATDEVTHVVVLVTQPGGLVIDLEGFSGQVVGNVVGILPDGGATRIAYNVAVIVIRNGDVRRPDVEGLLEKSIYSRHRHFPVSCFLALKSYLTPLISNNPPQTIRVLVGASWGPDWNAIHH